MQRRVNIGNHKLADRRRFPLRLQVRNDLGHIALGRQPLHVRLPGSHPNFADEDVLEDHFLASVVADDQLGRLVADLERIELDHPFAVLAGFRLLLLPGKLDGDLRARRAPTPDRHRHLALENGVVGKRRAQLDAQRGPGRRICGRLFILCTEDGWHQKDGRREREDCRHPRFHVLDAKTVDDAR